MPKDCSCPFLPLYLSLPVSVTIQGKGNRIRHCPLWSVTADALKMAVEGRAPTERVFLNRCRRCGAQNYGTGITGRSLG